MVNDRSNWLATLTSTERDVALTAMRAHERIVEAMDFVGGCYFLSFFLHEYLKREKNIHAAAVVGWVNDGTSALIISHAWLELSGKKTDIALTRTEFPDIQLPGPLIVLDHIVRTGMAAYTYHRDRSPEALAELSDVDPDVVKQSENDHDLMANVAASGGLIAAYLANAPPHLSYAYLSRLML